MQEHRLDFGSFKIDSWATPVADETGRRFIVRANCICGVVFQAEDARFTDANALIARDFARHLTAMEAGQNQPVGVERPSL